MIEQKLKELEQESNQIRLQNMVHDLQELLQSVSVEDATAIEKTIELIEGKKEQVITRPKRPRIGERVFAREGKSKMKV